MKTQHKKTYGMQQSRTENLVLEIMGWRCQASQEIRDQDSTEKLGLKAEMWVSSSSIRY